MTYEAALAYIASLEPRGWRLGLDRMRAFCLAAGIGDALGPESPRFVHVAGTNGKGSTTAYLQSLMVEAGYRTGAFFSPYVVDPRERVQIGRDLIPKDDLARMTEKLIPVAENFTDTEFGGITEFEFKTALGFAYWKAMECEWVAMEVGLGGRFDATNVITPAASIIVSIGYDHVAILGDTLAKIAGEKAGIIKPGIPVIVGDLPAEALTRVKAVAEENAAPLWLWGRDIAWEETTETLRTPMRTIERMRPGIAGEMQGHNMALAVAAFIAAGGEASDEQLRRGVASAFVPGRFQVLQKWDTTFLLDGAHNGESAALLRQSMDKAYPSRDVVLLTNMVQGHEPGDVYRHFAGRVKSAHVVPIDFHRAQPPAVVEGALRELSIPATAYDSVDEGLRKAAAEAGPDGIVLVTGSFYLVGDILCRLPEPSGLGYPPKMPFS